MTLVGSEWILVLYGLVMLTLVYLRWRKQWPGTRLLFLALFAAYLSQVLLVTILPIPVDRIFDPDLSEVPLRGWIEVRPFIISFHPSILWTQTVPNVLIGVPFGFGAWFVLGKPSLRVVLAAGLATFLFIELLQFAIALALVGYPYRVSDISDLLLNGFGVLVGAGVFLAFASIWRALDRGVPGGDVVGYVRQVVHRPSP